MRTLMMLALTAGLFLCGGCATLIRGDSQKIKFDTDPEGATVKVDDAQTYATPTTVELKRNKEHSILISKEGYRPVTFVMKAQWDGASLAQVAAPGGSAMLATDRASGADLAFYPIPKIKLTPANGDNKPIEMAQYYKQLLTKEAYDKAVAEDREEKFRQRD